VSFQLEFGTKEANWLKALPPIYFQAPGSGLEQGRGRKSSPLRTRGWTKTPQSHYKWLGKQ